EGAQARAHRQRLLRRVQPVDERPALVRGEDGGEDAQGGGLAGAVGAQKAGDLPIPGDEGDAPEGLHLAERLVELLDLDHGSCPRKSRNMGAGAMSATQVVSSWSTEASRSTLAMSEGRQPRGETLWPWPFTTRWRLWVRVFLASSARSGGVTGSASPERRRTGTSERTGSLKDASTVACGQRAQTVR